MRRPRVVFVSTSCLRGEEKVEVFGRDNGGVSSLFSEVVTGLPCKFLVFSCFDDDNNNWVASFLSS